MLKCSVCFLENLENLPFDAGCNTPAEEVEEQQRIAMAQSRTAETIINGTALCAIHAGELKKI